MRDTQRERQRHRHRRRRLHEGSLIWDLIPGLQDHTLGPRQAPNCWVPRGSQYDPFKIRIVEWLHFLWAKWSRDVYPQSPKTTAHCFLPLHILILCRNPTCVLASSVITEHRPPPFLETPQKPSALCSYWESCLLFPEPTCFFPTPLHRPTPQTEAWLAAAPWCPEVCLQF